MRLAAEHPNQPGFLTTAAWVRIETGRFDEARVQFDAIGADGFDSILRNGVWLPNMRLLSEIACALETPGARGARSTSCCSRTGTATS